MYLEEPLVRLVELVLLDSPVAMDVEMAAQVVEAILVVGLREQAVQEESQEEAAEAVVQVLLAQAAQAAQVVEAR